MSRNRSASFDDRLWTAAHARCRHAVAYRADVLVSFLFYVIVYAVVFGAGIFYMAKVARAGPPSEVELRDAKLAERPARPLSAAGI